MDCSDPEAPLGITTFRGGLITPIFLSTLTSDALENCIVYRKKYREKVAADILTKKRPVTADMYMIGGLVNNGEMGKTEVSSARC